MKTSAAVVILAFLVAFQAHAASGGAPVITFSATTVQVSGVTPGGTVVIYGVAYGRSNFTNSVTHFRAALTDDDHDGVVTYDAKRRIPPAGVWIAVDTRNGQFVIGAPGHDAVRGARRSATPFHKNAAGVVDTFMHDYPSVEMLYIHPGGGVWVVNTVDGGPLDRDPRSGATGVSLADAQSLMPPGDTRPAAFAPGGVLVAFDVSRFEVLTLHLTGADLAGAQ